MDAWLTVTAACLAAAALTVPVAVAWEAWRHHDPKEGDMALYGRRRSPPKPELEHCPRCGSSNVVILPGWGGTSRDLTSYSAYCGVAPTGCGLLVSELSADGTMRSARYDYNRWAKAEKAKEKKP